MPVRQVSPIVFGGKLYLFWIETSSRSVSDVASGSSSFVGYKHEFKLYYSYLRLDGTWAPSQRVSMFGTYPFENSDGVVDDPLIEEDEQVKYEELLNDLFNGVFTGNMPTSSEITEVYEELLTPRYDTEPHSKAREGYTLEGFQWSQIYLDPVSIPSEGNRIFVCGTNYQLNTYIDLKTNKIGELFAAQESYLLDHGFPQYGAFLYSADYLYQDSGSVYLANLATRFYNPFAYACLLQDEGRLDAVTKYWSVGADLDLDSLVRSIYGTGEKVVRIDGDSELKLVNGSPVDAFFEDDGDQFILQTSVRSEGGVVRRVGTTIHQELSSTLFTSGVDSFLSVENQQGLEEARLPVSLETSTEDLTNSETMDYTGPYGVYFREMFFHIPFTIANQLNSQGKYEEAQAWYRYIFNPTAVSDGTTTDSSDRVWQYREFREHSGDSLRSIVTNDQVISEYLRDPYNPHAIARLRLSAYQKATVLKYVDNILDWADDLFTQYERETVNEAILLYIYALEILGERPSEVGDCEGDETKPKTYENISPDLTTDSQFLIQMENFSIGGRLGRFVGLDTIDLEFSLSPITISSASTVVARSAGLAGLSSPELGEVSGPEPSESDLFQGFERGRILPNRDGFLDNLNGAAGLGASLLSGSPVFCFPISEDLLAFWDRVEDRLHKIRNCMDITGTKRSLALFAPEIDPNLLVRAQAAGLDLSAALGTSAGDLPPYRFQYLIERAKSYAGTVQSFGSALLSALEQKDLKELEQLQATQEQNLLKLNTSVREWEIESAEAALSAIEKRKAGVENRVTYYQELVNAGLSGWEVAQSAATHSAALTKQVQVLYSLQGGITKLLPNIGSPFAMTFGGEQLGGSLKHVAEAYGALASISESVSRSAGLEATFQRRKEEWQFQLNQANDELAALEEDARAAEMRKEIASRSLETHEKQLEQNQERLEFYQGKFTNLGLYTWLSSQLQGLFRDAYNSAYRMAQLAEQAYHFERPKDETVYIDGTFWDSSYSGLTSGESLLMALQGMEQHHLESNYRSLEVTQTFSLRQIDPEQLFMLQMAGTCDFGIPEFYFNLLYPGQYYRSIKSVQVTMPAVTGPYTNVGATLHLTDSKIRTEPNSTADSLKTVPPTRSVIVATSSGNQDAGVFNLTFEGSQYMPFEGCGAVESRWRLKLPSSFRSFDYESISDVLLRISYTAEYDEAFAATVEEENAATEGSLIKFASENDLYKLFSFRREFSAQFHKLKVSEVDSDVSISIEQNHLPFFMAGRGIDIQNAKLYSVANLEDIGAVELSLNGTSISGFTKEADSLFSLDVTVALKAGAAGGESKLLREHLIKVVSPGNLALEAASESDSAIDSNLLSDLILVVAYRVSA